MQLELWDDRHLRSRDLVMVDFNVPGAAALNLDHHFGQRTPADLAHDLATGVALNYAKAGKSGAQRAVTIDHYDTDGVLSVFALLHTEQAVEREVLLLGAAHTGDFFEWIDAAAAAVSLTLQDDILERCVQVPKAQRLGWCFDEALGILPRLIEEPGRYRERWEPRLSTAQDAIERLRGAGAVEERPAEQLSIARLAGALPDLALATACREPVILHSTEMIGGRFRYDAWVRQRFSWGYQLETDPAAPLFDLSPAARRLQLQERRRGGNALWHCEEYESLGWRVRVTDSRLSEADVVSALARAIRAPVPLRRHRRTETFAHRAWRAASREWSRRRPVTRSH